MGRKIREVLFSALQCAKDDRQSFVEAYDGDKSQQAVRAALKQIKEFEQLQKQLFGTTRSAMDAILDGADVRTINIFNLRRLFESRMDEEE